MTKQDVKGPEELKDYWRCFFCDFATTNCDEAEAHFGDRDDTAEFKPVCKWWANTDESERKYTLQDTLRDLNYERMENHKQYQQIKAMCMTERGGEIPDERPHHRPHRRARRAQNAGRAAIGSGE
jgi:hypothetical protein